MPWQREARQVCSDLDEVHSLLQRHSVLEDVQRAYVLVRPQASPPLTPLEYGVLAFLRRQDERALPANRYAALVLREVQPVHAIGSRHALLECWPCLAPCDRDSDPAALYWRLLPAVFEHGQQQRRTAHVRIDAYDSNQAFGRCLRELEDLDAVAHERGLAHREHAVQFDALLMLHLKNGLRQRRLCRLIDLLYLPAHPAVYLCRVGRDPYMLLHVLPLAHSNACIIPQVFASRVSKGGGYVHCSGVTLRNGLRNTSKLLI